MQSFTFPAPGGPTWLTQHRLSRAPTVSAPLTSSGHFLGLFDAASLIVVDTGPRSLQSEAQRLAALLQDARDPVDLEELLDTLVADPDIDAAAARVHTDLFAGRFPEFPDADAFIAQIGRQSDDERVVMFVQQALVFAGWIGEVTAATEATTTEASAPSESFNVYTLPMPLFDVVTAHLRGRVCLAGLVDVALSAEKRPNGMHVALAHFWAKGELGLLRAADAIDPGHVPDAVLPPSLRIDGKAAYEEQARQHEVFEAVIEKERAVS